MTANCEFSYHTVVAQQRQGGIVCNQRTEAFDEFYAGWRGRWIADGKPWFSTGRQPPEGWSADEQLARLRT